MLRTYFRFQREIAGQSLVEFALASVIFFVTIFGTIEFGRAIWAYNMVSDLAQEGARYAAVHGANGTPPSANQSTVQTYVQGRAPFTIALTMSPSTVGGQGTTIAVTVSTNFTPMTAILPVTSTMTLQSTARMVVQR
jgi:Flp pilus assembly protein TadG